MDMATKYANLIKTMLLVGFYAPALPCILILASVGLILTYWADKVFPFNFFYAKQSHC